MANFKIKKTGRFLMTAVPSTFLELYLLFLPSFAVFRFFAVTSRPLWIISYILVSLAVAWVKGIEAGVMLGFDLNIVFSGIISSLVLNSIIVIKCIKYFSYSTMISLILIAVICLNCVVSSSGYKFAHKYNDLKPSHGINRNLLLLITANYIFLIPFFLIGWLAIILFLKHATSFSI